MNVLKLLIPAFLISIGCSDNTERIPDVFVDVLIDVNDPQYAHLKQIQGFTIIEGGVRGIIIYQHTFDDYRAYDRSCSFNPLSDCATLDIDSVSIQAFDTCCNSTFQLVDGLPLSGPAAAQLKLYNTSLEGGLLRISNF